MTTVESTTEKTFLTLTGNECIPLSDKTHIKTQLLKDLKALVDKAAQEEHVMYRNEYQLQTLASAQAEAASGTIRFGGMREEGGEFQVAEYIEVDVPHAARYYVVLNGLKCDGELTFSYGANNYRIDGTSKPLHFLTEGETTIRFNVSEGWMNLESVRVTESGVELPSNKTYVDSNNCLILDV